MGSGIRSKTLEIGWYREWNKDLISTVDVSIANNSERVECRSRYICITRGFYIWICFKKLIWFVILVFVRLFSCPLACWTGMKYNLILFIIYIFFLFLLKKLHCCIGFFILSWFKNRQLFKFIWVPSQILCSSPC